ncbi:hypothetical protein yc1106_09497 [Curvularia clavata]|uniref:Uncharacterized protein n=1 Tax=Curvularia clavata TaxID=95742 RepID=A0A9Q9DVI7_CURCL|nr:hypothetical protein yc1106_09497 [Curvularia clavata]
MLISARANFKQLDMALLLVDLASWSRKCSVCLAIMNERWHEDLLFKLENQLETLSDDTLRSISSGLAAERHRPNGQAPSIIDTPNLEQTTRMNATFTKNTEPDHHSVAPNISNEIQNTEWEPFAVFSEFLDADFMNTYWDIHGLENEFPTNYQSFDLEGQIANLQDAS